jgi:predicted small lipoprotein YifL
MRFLALLLLVSSFTACTNKPAGPLAFVTNERDGTITVIDTNTDRVTSSESKQGSHLGGD